MDDYCEVILGVRVSVGVRHLGRISFRDLLCSGLCGSKVCCVGVYGICLIPVPLLGREVIVERGYI